MRELDPEEPGNPSELAAGEETSGGDNAADGGDNAADVQPIDPEIWRRIIRRRTDEFDVVLLAMDFKEAAKQEANPVLRKVLDILGNVSSLQLKPESWSDPFEPMITYRGGARSFLPVDLSTEDRSLLMRVADAFDEDDDPSLRARVHDICWTFIDRKNRDWLEISIESYTSHALDSESWFRGGKDEQRRALELARRLGKAGGGRVARIAKDVQERLRRITAEDYFFGVQLSQFARLNDLISQGDAREFANHARSTAEAARELGDLRLAESWERECCDWSVRGSDQDASRHALLRLAKDLSRQAADRRVGVGGEPNSAGHFTEQALKVLVGLPRGFRAAQGADDLIAELRESLKGDRQEILESMVRTEGETIDLSTSADRARLRVSGQEPIRALVEVAGFAPLADPKTQIETARQVLDQTALLRILPRQRFGPSGQKIAASSDSRSGVKICGVEIESAVWSSIIDNNTTRISLYVHGMIRPGLEVANLDHRYDFDMLYEACRQSALVPLGHEALWALGLLRGLDGDFMSASLVLAPQMEHWVRLQLKKAGVYTLVVDKDGVESEKGLGALLQDEQAERALTDRLVFELRCLMTDQGGPNLRNNLAHGFVSDADFASDAMVYAWWLALKIFVGGLPATVS